MLFRSLKDEVLNYFAKRISYVTVIILIVFVLLFARLFYLQVISYNKFLSLADTNRIRIVKVFSERGFIFDRNGKILVKNAPTYQLSVTKEDVSDLPKLLSEISKVVSLDIISATQSIKKSYYYQPAVIARGLTFEQIAYFLEHSSDYPGLEVGLQVMREYTDGLSVSQIIGYTGEISESELKDSKEYSLGDNVGKNGLEKYYEKFLRGIDGAKQIQVDSMGRVTDIVNEKKPLAGNDLILTIDYELQKFITDGLKDRRGAVVVLDIRDNSVLAMVSAPTYDLRLFSPFILGSDWDNLITDSNKPLINRAIEGVYPPGSVYKVVMALAGLKEGVIKPETVFHCTGNYILNENFNYFCWLRRGHGNVNLRRGLSESCDVYFYNLGKLLEIDKIQWYSNFFSLGKQTGVDLPNERSGFFPSKKWKTDNRNEQWYPGETIITSIGQGYMVATPLQIAVMMSGIFNGGKVYKPRLVDKITSNIDGSTITITQELVGDLEIPKQMQDQIMAGLVDAVYAQGGTSRRAAVSEVRIGGKTGTAQVVSLKKTEGMKRGEIPELWRDHSWFTGVFPAEEPKYAVVVMVENGGSGGKSAAPLGGEVIKKMLELKYVEKN